MGDGTPESLRVLIANQPRDLPALVRKLVATLGHGVVAPQHEGDDVAGVIADARPDVALVTIGHDADDALALIEEIVDEAACPVIALIDSPDPDHLREASKRGVFAYVTEREGEQDWQNAIDIGLRRFGDFRRLKAAIGRRAVIERAKGILMERHSVDETIAFDLLRNHSRTSNQRLIDLASAVASGHALLPSSRATRSEPNRPGPLMAAHERHARA